MSPSNYDDDALISREVKPIMNALVAISAEPIQIKNEKSALERILQWKAQEQQCIKFQNAAETYNLLHLASLVRIYEELIEIGKKMKKNNVKKWVVNFMCSNLGINRKMEQRNRVGCDRLRNLFSEGISCEQLVRAGCRKCDFFAKKENYEIFLAQIPSLEMRHSISPNIPNQSRLSEVPEMSTQVKVYQGIKSKNNVTFKLSLGNEFEEYVDKYQEDEFIVFNNKS